MNRTILLIAFLLVVSLTQAAVQKKKLSVQFETDRHELTALARQQLSNFLAPLGDDTDFSIRLEGHTDDVGNLNYNDALAARRSLAVKKFLVENGVSEVKIEYESFGERKPLKPNLNDGHRDVNRRVDVRLVIYDFDSTEELEQTLREGTESRFVLDPEQQNVVSGPGGVRVLIEPNTFVDAEGIPVKEPVAMTLTEAMTFNDFVSHNLATISNEQLLVSGGMLQLSAQTISGKEVVLNPKTPVTTAVTVDQVEPGMQLFSSSDGGNWSLTENRITTSYTLDMPPYPLLNYRSFYMPQYRRNLSTKPEEPETYGRPRPPRVPDQQHYKADITWYNFFLKGHLERQAHARYLAAMERYHAKEELYKKRYDLYVKHNADKEKRYRQYKLNLREWHAQCVADSLAYYNSTAYKELKEKNLLLLADARAKWESEVEKWEALRLEKMGALAEKMDLMGVATEEAVNTYMFTMSELSWINIDRFYKMPANEMRAVTLRDIDQSPERVFVIFKEINSMLPMVRSEFRGIYKRDRFPKAEKAALLAYKVIDGKAMVYLEDLDPKRSSYKMEFVPYTFRDLQKMLAEIQG